MGDKAFEAAFPKPEGYVPTMSGSPEALAKTTDPTPAIKPLTTFQKLDEMFHHGTKEAAKLFVTTQAMGPAGAGLKTLAAKTGKPLLEAAAKPVGEAAVNFASGVLDPQKGQGRLASGLTNVAGGAVGGATGKAIERTGQQALMPAIRRAVTDQAAAAERATAQKGAGTVAAELQTLAPTLKGFPATEKGLDDMLYGKGRRMVHEQYDKVMDEIAKKGAGKEVQVSPRTLDALQIPYDPPPAAILPGSPPPMVKMDAATLAEATTGKWKTAPGAYRRVTEELDKLGIGNPAARAEYKAFSGFSRFIDKSGAMKDGQFRPDAVLRGLHEERKMLELERRGLGNASEGVFSQVAAPKAAKPEVPGRLEMAVQGPPVKQVQVGGHTVPTELPDWMKRLLVALGGQYSQPTTGAALNTLESAGKIPGAVGSMIGHGH